MGPLHVIYWINLFSKGHRAEEELLLQILPSSSLAAWLGYHFHWSPNRSLLYKLDFWQKLIIVENKMIRGLHVLGSSERKQKMRRQERWRGKHNHFSSVKLKTALLQYSFGVQIHLFCLCIIYTTTMNYTLEKSQCCTPDVASSNKIFNATFQHLNAIFFLLNLIPTVKGQRFRLND